MKWSLQRYWCVLTEEDVTQQTSTRVCKLNITNDQWTLKTLSSTLSLQTTLLPFLEVEPTFENLRKSVLFHHLRKKKCWVRVSIVIQEMYLKYAHVMSEHFHSRSYLKTWEAHKNSVRASNTFMVSIAKWRRKKKKKWTSYTSYLCGCTRQYIKIKLIGSRNTQ